MPQKPSSKAHSRLWATLLSLFVVALGVAAGVLLSFYYPLAASAPRHIQIPTNNEQMAVVDSGLPFGQLHWQAHLEIEAAGYQVPIPAGIGVTIGNNIDNDVSGIAAAPMHTQANGTLELDVVDPRNHLDRMTLGYFFGRVWGQAFSYRCIMQYCNGAQGKVRLFVNGVQNEQYEDYLVNDGDSILVSYEP